MSIYRFGAWRFDAQRLELHVNGEPVPLRPKAAQVLGVLLANSGRTVSKREIFAAVWQCAYTRDQTLFQTISELRRQLAPLDPIRTLPNIGYRWAGPARQARPRAAHWLVAGLAGLATAALLQAGSALIRANGVPSESAAANLVHVSPAMRAFASGLSHLGARQVEKAASDFALSARRNPAFLEARLLHGEALLAAGKFDDVRAGAETLVTDSAAARDMYTQISALELLSRTHWRLGRPDAALGWALTATTRARELKMACLVDDDRNSGARRVGPQQTPLDAGLAAAPGNAISLEPQFALAIGLPVSVECAAQPPAGLETGAQLAPVDPSQRLVRCLETARETRGWSSV